MASEYADLEDDIPEQEQNDQQQNGQVPASALDDDLFASEEEEEQPDKQPQPEPAQQPSQAELRAKLVALTEKKREQEAS